MATVSRSSSFRSALAVTDGYSGSPAAKFCVFCLEVMVSCLLRGDPFFVGDLVSLLLRLAKVVFYLLGEVAAGDGEAAAPGLCIGREGSCCFGGGDVVAA